MLPSLVIATAIVGRVSLEQEFVDHVDIIELNHCHDQQGRKIGDWWIFWEWDGCDHKVVAWKSWARKADAFCRQRARLRTFDNSAYRTIFGRSFRETWTFYDPEMRDRYIHPHGQRKRLVPLVFPSAVRLRLDELEQLPYSLGETK